VIVGRYQKEKDERWDRWLAGVEGANIKQSLAYRPALALYGCRSEILALEQSGEIVGGTLLAIRDFPPPLGCLVRTSGGLALSDWSDTNLFVRLLKTALDRCQALNASSLEVSVRLVKEVGTASAGITKLESALLSLGFELTKGQGTYLVDLNLDSEDSLLKSFGKNPRRHIRKALRDGLIVKRANNEQQFLSFEKAHRAVCGRKKLSPLPRGFFSQVLLPLVQAGYGELFVAYYDGSPRNYVFTGSVGQPIYHWGALANTTQAGGCPQTGQALHYAAMCHFMEIGKPVYDFGGSPGTVPSRGHPNFGVWKFKSEFQGRYVHFLGTWRCRLRPFMSTALDIVRKTAQFKP